MSQNNFHVDSKNKITLPQFLLILKLSQVCVAVENVDLDIPSLAWVFARLN